MRPELICNVVMFVVCVHMPGHKAAAEKNMVSGSLLSDLESLSARVLSSSLPSTDDKQPSANNSSSDSGPHRRAKRFLSYPRFVEVMVVADYKMVEHHRNNLQHYILTLMSIVSSVWCMASGLDFLACCYFMHRSSIRPRTNSNPSTQTLLTDMMNVKNEE